MSIDSGLGLPVGKSNFGTPKFGLRGEGFKWVGLVEPLLTPGNKEILPLGTEACLLAKSF